MSAATPVDGVARLPHTSVWWDGVVAPERPVLEGDRDCDVAVVGAGITGLTTALLAARAGYSVCVIDQAQVAHGTSGHTTGKVTSQHHLTYGRLVATHGRSGARIYADSMEAAKERVADLAEGIACDLERVPAYLFASGAGQRTLLELEERAARAAGLPMVLEEQAPLPFETYGALRLDDQLQLHAVRYLLGLAERVEEAGGVIRCGTRATGVVERPEGCVVRTEHGNLRADHVVVATLLPFLDRGLHFARMQPSRSHVVTARVRDGLPTGMLQGASPRGRSFRSVRFGDETLLMALGQSHRTGEATETDHHTRLAEYVARHWPVDAFVHRWSAQDFMPDDGIPYIGTISPRSERVHVATGLKKWGLTGGTLAAMLITDAIVGQPNPWARLFSASRFSPISGGLEMAAGNGRVAFHFVADRLRERPDRRLEELAPGEGAIVSLGGRKVAGHRDADGVLHAVDARCTHLGCQVRWNALESSWDCPCHGSRFTPDGDVIEGPATSPLTRHRPDPG